MTLSFLRTPFARKKTMPLYCARLLVVCLVDDRRLRRHLCDHPLILLEARDDQHAFKRALELGRQQEMRYRNGSNQEVRWALARVESIKRLGDSLDGVEVGSVLDYWHDKQRVSFRRRFKPESHLPLFEGA